MATIDNLTDLQALEIIKDISVTKLCAYLTESAMQFNFENCHRYDCQPIDAYVGLARTLSNLAIDKNVRDLVTDARSFGLVRQLFAGAIELRGLVAPGRDPYDKAQPRTEYKSLITRDRLESLALNL